jgi:phage baseplate assembly protein W
MAQIKEYSDFDLNFIAHPQTGDLVKVKGINSILQSIKNLVLTNFYEKPFHPEIGSGIRGLLFEPSSNSVASQIEDAIEKVIKDYEPRVSIIEIIVEANDDGSNYSVQIEFRVVNQIEPLTVRFFLNRVR